MSTPLKMPRFLRRLFRRQPHGETATIYLGRTNEHPGVWPQADDTDGWTELGYLEDD